MSQEDREQHPPPESFDDFLAFSRAGYVYTSPDGRIIFASPQIIKWLKSPADGVLGSRLSDHFPIVRKVYYETHLAPLLRMQGFFDEIAFDLVDSEGISVPVFMSAAERNDPNGQPRFICFSVFPGAERRNFERNMVAAKTLATSENLRLREQLAEDAKARLTAEERLAIAQQSAALREQFIAVLGHDLRNPLAAIEGAMRLIAKTPLSDRAATIVGMVHQSVSRMADIIDNVMDFARGRLGGGIAVHPRMTDMSPVISHVIDELEVAWPHRVIERRYPERCLVLCDAKRIGQLLSNLLANALVHGAADGPVTVTGETDAACFTLSVANCGEPIPPEALERLFEPFTREDLRPSQQGLGLGLYIASQIAKAHAGNLTVVSSPDITRFTLTIPQKPAVASSNKAQRDV